MLSLAFSDVVVFCCCADVWMLFYITFLHNKVYRRRSIYGGVTTKRNSAAAENTRDAAYQ